MPFVKTAYVSNAGVARQGGNGENIIHFNAIRMRVTGNGNLEMTLYSLDDVNSQELNPFVLTGSTNIQPTMLANFIEQRASLKMETTEINDYFRINRIVFFTKELWAEYPG